MEVIWCGHAEADTASVVVWRLILEAGLSAFLALPAACWRGARLPFF